MSLYLICSVGMNAANKLICECVAAALRALKSPWVIGGDWNMPPDALAASGFLRLVNGTICSLEASTCGEKSFDYFVVFRSLSHAVVAVQRVDGVGVHPHHPARLILRGDARRHAVRKICRAPKVHAALQHGPLLRPPCYQNVQDIIAQVPERLYDIRGNTEAKHAIDAAALAWAKHARTEWNSISTADVLYKETRFIWASAAGPIATPWAGESRVSSVWRGLAQRVKETAVFFSRATMDESHRRLIR